MKHLKIVLFFLCLLTMGLIVGANAQTTKKDSTKTEKDSLKAFHRIIKYYKQDTSLKAVESQRKELTWEQSDALQEIHVNAPDQSEVTFKQTSPILSLDQTTSETYCNFTSANTNSYAAAWKKRVPYGTDTSVYFYPSLCAFGDSWQTCYCVDLGTCVPINIK